VRRYRLARGGSSGWAGIGDPDAQSAGELDELCRPGVGVGKGGRAAGAASAGGGGLTGVRLADGIHVALDALIVAPRMTANAELLTPLGLTPTEVCMGEQVMGTQIDADPSGATSVPGVWAAGNLANIAAQVITSAAAGLTAGAAINADLAAEDAKRAADATPRTPATTAGLNVLTHHLKATAESTS